MKILRQIHPSRVLNERGNTLLIALIVAAIVTPLIWASVYMTGVQQRTVAVSQDWNAAIPVIEAGIEEAMAHLNKNCLVREEANWAADDWIYDSGLFYVPLRMLPDGSYYEVRIITNSPSGGASDLVPQIVCMAGVPTRFGVKKYSSTLLSLSGPQFATIGSSQEVDRSTNDMILNRQVRVTATRFSWADVGQLSDGDLGASGNIKSFSSEGASSMWGRYYPPLATDAAVVASIGGDINLHPNATIYGSAMTGPDGSTNGSGTIGDTNWINGGSTGIQPGKYSNNFQYEMPEPELPSGAVSWPTLSPCNCWTTYTNRYMTNGSWVTTTNYPYMPPPGGLVVTNTNDVFYSSAYFTTYPGPPILTNSYTNSVIGISNVPSGATIISTQVVAGAWKTNYAPTATSPAQTPLAGNYLTSPSGAPSGYSYIESAGIYVFLKGTNYAPSCSELTIPTNCYVGSVTNIDDKATKCTGTAGGAWIPRYSYALIHEKRYQEPGGTNYTYYIASNYLYAATTYSYYGPKTNDLVVTDFFRYVAPGGNWQVGSISLSGQDLMLITGGRNVIYVSGSFSITGKARMIIAPGSSVEFYMGGDVNIAGNGISNLDEQASDLLIYGLSTCTDIQLSGNAKLVAGILAPNADITINGGGSRGLIIGAMAGKSITSHGNPVDFVHDLSLAGHVGGYYYPTEWKEEAPGTP